MYHWSEKTGPTPYATRGPRGNTSSSSIPPLWRAAEEFHSHGLCVIPLLPRSKRPAIASWREYQRRLPDVSERWDWFGECPERNIAIVGGRVSGGGDGRSLGILDFDSTKSYANFEKAHPRLVANTWVAQSARGPHVYLRTYGAVPTFKFEGGEVRGEGAYVVAPPSIHPSGVQYRWIRKPPEIAVVPNLFKLIRREPPKTGPLPPKIYEGERNNTLFRRACALRGAGWAAEEIEEALQVLNRRRCVPPLSEKEVAQIAKSAGRYVPGKGKRSQILRLADPVAAAVIAVASAGGWTGTASELLGRLELEFKGVTRRRRKLLPSTPRVLSSRLRHLVPTLQRLGVNVAFTREAGTGRRIITLTPRPATPPCPEGKEDLIDL